MEGPDLTPPSRAEPTGVDHLLDHASVAACAILPGAELSRATRIAPHGHAPSGTLAFPQAHGAGAPQAVLPDAMARVCRYRSHWSRRMNWAMSVGVICR